ncbi:class I adenylate-forming enzyme family protein [Mycolicibacterium sp. XJ1819]
MNIATLLEMSAEGFGDRTAYGRPTDGVSFRRLLELSEAAAHRFRSGSVDHVALVDENSAAVPVTLFGAALAGVAYAPINYRLAEDAIAALLERLGRTALVAGAGHDHLPTNGGEVISPAELLCAPPRFNEAVFAPGGPDDVAIRLFTSGTTGAPKAAVLRHRNLSSYVLGTVEFGGAGETEAALVSVPPYHVAGVASVLSAVYAGRRVVQLPRFTAESWISAVIDEQITHAMVVPTMLTRIVDLLAHRAVALPSLRHLSYGGGRMPVPVIEQAMRLLPDVSFVNAYGLTETSSTVALLGPDDHREAFASDDPGIRRRLGSVGRPIAGIEIEIRDTDGKCVGPEVSGEVWLRGAQVAGEYTGIDRRTSTDGWFPTNDGGYLDPDGYLFLEGRLDDVIVRGGENMSPGEIEDVLLQHDAISDAAVIGAPDSEWGEKVVAFVISNSSTLFADDVREWVRGRLRSSRAPHDVHFVDELPYTDTGKLLRRELRRRLSEPSSPTPTGQITSAP